MSNNTGIDAKIVPNTYQNFSDVFWVPGRPDIIAFLYALGLFD